MPTCARRCSIRKVSLVSVDAARASSSSAIARIAVAREPGSVGGGIEQPSPRARRRARGAPTARRRPPQPHMRCVHAPACRPAPAQTTRRSSGPTAAAARCQARRSTSRSGSASASARCARRRSAGARVAVDRRTRERVAELDRAALDADEPAPARPSRGRRCRGRAARPRARARRPRRRRSPRRREAGRARRPTAWPTGAGTRARCSSRPAPARPAALRRAARRPGPARAVPAGCRPSSGTDASAVSARDRHGALLRTSSPAASLGRVPRDAATGGRRRRAASASSSRDASTTAIGSARRRRDREQQRLGARSVEPVGVVDEHEHGLVLRVRREEAQRRRADREAVLRVGRPQRERAAERVGLRLAGSVERAERRPQQLEQPAERHVRLGLDAARLQHAHARRLATGRSRAARSCRCRPRRRAQARRSGPHGPRPAADRGLLARARGRAACADSRTVVPRCDSAKDQVAPRTRLRAAVPSVERDTRPGGTDGNHRSNAGPLDLAKLEAFVFRAVDEVGATLNAALVVMGDKLGLYRAMAGAGPLDPRELAERAGVVRALRARVAERPGRGRLRRVRPGAAGATRCRPSRRSR